MVLDQGWTPVFFNRIGSVFNGSSDLKRAFLLELDSGFQKDKEKLIDIGFLIWFLKGSGLMFSRILDGLIKYQSTSDTNVVSQSRLYKGKTARFFDYGIYCRKSS